MRSSRQTRPYECGLPKVTLVDVEILECPECGESELIVPKIEELHALLARTVASDPAKLGPQELRFLRSYLGFSGRDFAAEIGVSPETVSRWESRTAPLPMGSSSERLLRAMVFLRQPKSEYSRKSFRDFGQVKGEVLTRFVSKKGRGPWREAAPLLHRA